MKLNKSILALAVLGSFAASSAMAASSNLSAINHANDPETANADLTTEANTLKMINAEYRFFANDSLDVDYDVSNNPGTGTADRAVVYTPAVALSQGTSLIVNFANGGVAPDATMFLAIYDEAAGGGTGEWIQIATLSDFTSVTATDTTPYYSELKFLVDTSNTLAASQYTRTDAGVANVVGADTDPIPADTLIQLFTDNGNFDVIVSGDDPSVDLPVFVVPDGSANGTEVTAQVTGAKDDSSNDLTAPLTDAVTTVKLVDGLSYTMTTVADSTIDVENAVLSRGGFVVEAGGDTPSVVESESKAILTNTAEYTWVLDDATDTFVLKLDRVEGDQGVTDVELGGTDLTASVLDSSWSLASNMDADDLLVSADFEIFVNTTDNSTVNATTPLVLATGDWKYTLTMDPDAADAEPVDVPSFEVEPATTSHIWGINGMQAKVPYVYSINSAGWTSVMKFTNESTTGAAADIRMDIVVYDATTGVSVIPTGTEFTNVSLGNVDSQGQAAYLGSDIVTAINAQTPNTLDAATNYHFGVTFTVVAPQNSVHLAVQNKSPDSRADAPVLYNINEVCTVTTVDHDTGNVAADGSDLSSQESCKASRVWQ